MAKASKSKIDRNLLSLIAAATAAGQVYYVTKDEADPLMDHNPPLIEVNRGMIQDGKAAASITNVGAAMASGEVKQYTVITAQPNAVVSAFQIVKGAILPPSKRGSGLHGGAPKQYPFDTMEVGDSFFVPISEKHPNPVKTLGSTVSSANNRFAEKTGEVKTVTRKVRGEDRKAKVDANGSFVMETVQIPVRKLTRKFEIRGVEAGKAYGAYTAPEHGALISRTA